METNTTTATPSAPPTRISRKASAKPAAKLVKKASVDTDGIALKTICSQLKLEPRLARRKLRAANLAFHGKRARWNFTAAQAAKVKEILRA